jgi:uroporphyrinogen-III synthase
MHLLVTRPEPNAGELKARLEVMGHRATLCPLLEIDLTPGKALDLGGVQALVATSRNAIRSLAQSEALERARALPIFVVGPATAAEACAAGFTRIVEGPAAARDLVSLIADKASPANGALLHLSGDTLAFDLGSALGQAGFELREEVVYRTRPIERLEPAAADAIRTGALDGVILMSPRTASVFANVVSGAGLADPARRLTYFCMSDAVAQGLERLGPVDTRVARRPNTEEVLALLAQAAPESTSKLP